MTLEEVYEDVVKLSHDERVAFGKEKLQLVAHWLLERDLSEEKIGDFILRLTSLFSSADNVANQAEYKVFIDITGFDISYLDFHYLVSLHNSPEKVEEMNDIIDTFPKEIKFAICHYGLALLSADGVINEKERELFERILD